LTVWSHPRRRRAALASKALAAAVRRAEDAVAPVLKLLHHEDASRLAVIHPREVERDAGRGDAGAPKPRNVIARAARCRAAPAAETKDRGLEA